MAAASSCVGSRMPTSQLDTESVASPTTALKRELDGLEAQLRGLADRRARVEAELLRITCEETFLSGSSAVYRMASSPLNTVRMATRSGGSPEVEVASGPTSTGLHVSRSHCLVSGWTNLIVSLFWGDTVCT